MAFDLIVFNKQTYISMTETVDQRVNDFNQATGNAFALVPSTENQGDFNIRASFQAISGLVRRRDVYNGTNAIPVARLQQMAERSVKVPSGTPEIKWETAQYDWITRNPEEAAVIIGEQLAKGMLADMVNTAIAGAVASIKTVSELNHTAASALTFDELTLGAGKFGDRQGSLSCWVMHSTPMTKLWAGNIKNDNKLFDYGSVAVYADPFGRPIVMTDSEYLTTVEDSTQKYFTLGLQPFAMRVEPNRDFDANIIRSNGKENIQSSYQAQWSYNLDILGYSYKGSAAPTQNSQIADPLSWEKKATSRKDTAGVLVKSS